MFSLFFNSQKHIFSILSFCETTSLMISRLSPPQKPKITTKKYFHLRLCLVCTVKTQTVNEFQEFAAKNLKVKVPWWGSESESSLMRLWKWKFLDDADNVSLFCSGPASELFFLWENITERSFRWCNHLYKIKCLRVDYHNERGWCQAWRQSTMISVPVFSVTCDKK